MSELAHPPIDLDITLEKSLQQTFAEEAYVLLGECAVPRQVQWRDTITTTAVTERVDMVPASGSLALAMRLRSLAVMTAPNLYSPAYTTSEEFTVIMLEHAEFDDNSYDSDDDEKLAWRPYVMTVFANADPSELHVLNAQTGTELGDADLMTPSVLLSRLREELRSQRFENLEKTEILDTKYRKTPTGPDLIVFEPGEFLAIEDCDEPCNNVHFGCQHSPYSLN